MPPPSLSMTTSTARRPCRAAQSKPDASWITERSPSSAYVGSGHLGDAEARRHQPVDPAGATIGQNSQAGPRPHVHVEVANRHARSREEHAAIGNRGGEVARDAAFERLVPRVDEAHRRRYAPMCRPRTSRRPNWDSSVGATSRVARSAAITSAGSRSRVRVERRSGSATRPSGSMMSNRSALRTNSCTPREVGVAPSWMTRSAWWRSRNPAFAARSAPAWSGPRSSPLLSPRTPDMGSARSGQPRSAHSSTRPGGGTRRRPATTTTAVPRRHLAGESGQAIGVACP